MFRDFCIGSDGGLYTRHKPGWHVSRCQARVLFALVGERRLSRSRIQSLYFDVPESRRGRQAPLTPSQRASMSRSIKAMVDTGMLIRHPNGDLEFPDQRCRNFWRQLRRHYASLIVGTKEQFKQRQRDRRRRAGLVP